MNLNQKVPEFAIFYLLTLADAMNANLPLSLPRIVKFAAQVEAAAGTSLSNQSFQSFFSNSLSIEPGATTAGSDYMNRSSNNSRNNIINEDHSSNNSMLSSTNNNSSNMSNNNCKQGISANIGGDERLVKKKKISFEVGVHPSKENKALCDKTDSQPSEKFHNRNASLLARPRPIPDAMQPMDFGNWKISEWPKTVVIINGRPYVKLKRVGKGGSSVVYKVRFCVDVSLVVYLFVCLLVCLLVS
jgi:hypothetical protein